MLWLINCIRIPSLPLNIRLIQARSVGFSDPTTNLANIKLEEIISRHPSIHACIMFGRGEMQAGVLVEPVHDKKLRIGDEVRLSAFKDEIWWVTQQIN